LVVVVVVVVVVAAPTSDEDAASSGGDVLTGRDQIRQECNSTGTIDERQLLDFEY